MTKINRFQAAATCNRLIIIFIRLRFTFNIRNLLQLFFVALGVDRISEFSLERYEERWSNFDGECPKGCVKVAVLKKSVLN